MHTGAEFLMKVRVGGIHIHPYFIRSSDRAVFYSRTALSDCVCLEYKNTLDIEFVT
jgi:hypothetical protein